MKHGSLICGKAGAFALIWSKFRCTGESWAYLHDRSRTAYLPIPFGNPNRLGDIEYLCQNMRHRLTYLWQIRSFCWHIIEVLALLWSASQRVGSWDTAQVFLAQMPLSQPGFSWLMIEDHSQLRSSILSSMSFLDLDEANFDKLRVIMDVIIPAQARLKSAKLATEVHVLRLWISWPSAYRSIRTLHL